MSRKFNVGRQNDLLLNEKLHKLYTHLEFLSFKDGDGETISMPRQTKQTEIPKGALWLQHPNGTNINKMRVYTDPSAADLETRWPCLFEGYYHPVATKEYPKNPVTGQLYIDESNILHVFDGNNWQNVFAKDIGKGSYQVFNGMDFQMINPLSTLSEDGVNNLDLFDVPFESFGKYFTSKEFSDELVYCHPNPNSDPAIVPDYTIRSSENLIQVSGDSLKKYKVKAWSHINPQNLNKVSKRLIKITKSRTYYRAANKNPNGQITDTGALKVVAQNTPLSTFDSSTMVKVNVANENKYTMSMNFAVGDYVVPVEIVDSNIGYIPLSANKTEFYAFKSAVNNPNDEYGNKVGRLLKHHTFKPNIEYDYRHLNQETGLYENDEGCYINDFETKNGGIVLNQHIIDNYDYIYAITYEFQTSRSTEGELIRKYVPNLDGPDQIHVGSCSGIPVVFMDGLYLEHYENSGHEVYVYDNDTGNIVFSGNDVLDTMQITVVSFPNVNTYKSNGRDLPREYDIARFVKYNSDGSVIPDVVIKGEAGDTLFDKANFPNPLIFYNGLAGYTFVANEVSIDYNNKTITLHNFGDMIAESSSTVFAVSLGVDNYKGHGVLQNGVIYDTGVYANKSYLVIVDGIVMSPYNDDITVENGKITITDATIALDSEYTIIELNEDGSDTNAIMCIYDDMFAPYSIPIKHATMGLTNDYNNCDSAVVMCGPGVLVDREAIQREFNASDTFVGGQIVKSRLKSLTNDEIYEWRIYNYSNDYKILDPVSDAVLISDCENIISYYVNKATVQLNPGDLVDQPVTVYAYTYADSFDEPLLKAERIVPIEVKEDTTANYTSNTFYTNRTHLYDTGVNALSVFVNGVMVPHTEEVTTDSKSNLFFVDKLECSRFIDENGVNVYDVLLAIEDDTKLTDEITVVSGITRDVCLPMKYFNSEHQLQQAKFLKKYIQNDMKNNTLMYIIENVEQNEASSCRRQWGLPRYDNGSLPNSYTTTMRLTPGIINVYVNGVLLEKSDYAIFDSNKIMIGFDLIGGQELLGNIKDKYNCPYRVITEEGFKYIECENTDEVIMEVRDDLSIKKRTYTIKDISYETLSFDIIDYDYPISLNTTKDLIKIYINGVLYDGDYTNIDGVITLLDCKLEKDPLYERLRMDSDLMKEYENKYGEYKKHEDIITFEWR